jgi:hypothetical protein
MFDTVNFWIDRVNISDGKTFEIVPYLSEITEQQSEARGYSCSGKCLDYFVNVFENGISLKGSLSKSYFQGENISTLTRRATRQAIEKVSDCLHTDISGAKVTRLDVSTVILTKRPPCDYYQFLGTKARFKRLEAVKDETLYYTNHQRQIVFYDKPKEANSKAMNMPELLKNNYLLRYELRILKRVNTQLKTDVTAKTLHSEAFYQSIIQSWYNEFKTIQKLKNQSFMTANITTPKEAQTALFAYLLQQSGQSTIDEFLNELKAKNVFSDRKYYSRLKTDLNNIIAAPRGEQSNLMQELEMAIYNVAKYAR